MIEDIYRRLAERLDQIPNGFPPTASGVELKLLAKMFEPEEAKLAAVMRLTAEPASIIAERAGVDGVEAAGLLKAMRSKGLIRASKGEAGALYGLFPFIVGIYEEQLPRMDQEMAALFERYYEETQGGRIAEGGPPIHRVIPVDRSVPQELEIFPYERATEMLERARSWGVRDCICRVQQRLIGKGCEHTVKNCLVFAPVEGAFDGGGDTRPITKKRALEILEAAAEEGLVHSTMNQRDQIFYICSCCTCCCAIIRAVAEFGRWSAVARSDFHAKADADACTGCGLCIERCQFGALSLDDDLCQVDLECCVGCGVCTRACGPEALALQRRPEGEVEAPPAGRREWMVERARTRGVSIEDVL